MVDREGILVAHSHVQSPLDPGERHGQVTPQHLLRQGGGQGELDPPKAVQDGGTLAQVAETVGAESNEQPGHQEPVSGPVTK
ncbi:hypothetical protein DYH09_34690 [bacterium CPR1]|nr:hypothetical protein [bacterium CPR1]